MILNKGLYRDETSKIDYNLKESITWSSDKVILIEGENGVGKTRFLEGVLLKSLKREKKTTLYFGQDLENQILTFELISIVKNFIDSLKKSGNFFKAILFNHESHREVDVDFDTDAILNPDKESIEAFIKKESIKYSVDVALFDEVDKYFNDPVTFIEILEKVDAKKVFVISHVLDKNRYRSLFLKRSESGVTIE